MAPLPKPISFAALPISSALSEGRAEDAMDELIRLLETGNADRVVQKIAADWIRTLGIRAGDAKALRGGRPAVRKEWLDIAEMVRALQDDGKTYGAAVEETMAYFGYKRRHVESCVAMWNKAEAEARAEHD